MKKLSLLMAGLLLTFGQAHGANKVYPLGTSTHGIVADNNDWTCSVVTNVASTDGWMGCSAYVKGKANHLPIEFYFFRNFIGWKSAAHSAPQFSSTTALVELKSMLLQCAQTTNTVFNNLRLKDSNSNIHVFDGTYFDNSASGFFAMYIKPESQFNFVMFIKIQSGLLDEQTRENLCNKAFALITPLVS